ncbi:hypothetical protein ACHAXT_008366 [Thalassiosira profunda]
MGFCDVKFFVLSLLVIQNTCFVLLLRYSRTLPGTMYLASTAVACDEAVKLVTCLGILTFAYLIQNRRRGDGGGDYSKLDTTEHSQSQPQRQGTIRYRASSSRLSENEPSEHGDESECSDNGAAIEQTDSYDSFLSYLREELQFDIRVAGIAGLYTVQKNLIYFAISNLDAAVFMVAYQGKILTTAVFSVVLLKRELSCQKIVALVILTIGIAIVELDHVDNSSQSQQEQNRWMGMLGVLGACCTSGFSCVYFEKVLKPQKNPDEDPSSPPRPPPSVWAKNVQLSGFGLIIALVTAFVKDHKAIFADGFFQGYSPLVVLVVVMQAGGGLVVAAIIKWADNILKNFATGISIVTSTLVSSWAFGFSISKMFAEGCLLQFIAIWLYSREDKAPSGRDSSAGQMKSSESEKAQTSEISLVHMSSGDRESLA